MLPLHIKVQEKLSSNLPQEPEVEVELQLHWGERLTPRLDSFTASEGEREVTHCAGDWVGFRGSLNGCGREKTSYTHRGSNPEPSSPLQVAIALTLLRPHRSCIQIEIQGKYSEIYSYEWRMKQRSFEGNGRLCWRVPIFLQPILLQ